jgi:hypothetical protein
MKKAKSKVFRVYCEFLVKATDERQVISYLQEEDDFVERHIIVEEDNIAGGFISRLKAETSEDAIKNQEEIYIDLTK